MALLSLTLILCILFLNLWGSALAVGWYWKNRWLALAIGPLLFTTLMFGIECHWGLGALNGFLPLTTLASAALVYYSRASSEPRSWSDRAIDDLWDWRDEFRLEGCWGMLLVFLGLFGYAFAWRYAFPDIDGSSEKLSDLSYICSYMSGGKIPVLDAWLSPFRSVQYYSFQHYAAALFGRMFALQPGFTYNLAFCILIALTGFSFVGAVVHLASKTWVRVLVVLTFVLGGTGASGVLRMFYKDPQPWTGMRFIGCLPYDAPRVGLAAQAYANTYKHQELPGEPFAYSIFLGDYHPPISGYYMLGVGVLAAVLFERSRKRRYALIVGGTLTWSVLMNTWSMPLQLFWIAGWSLYRFREWRTLWLSIAGGAALVWFLGWIYLDAFAVASIDYKTAFKFVPWDAHTPVWLFMLYLGPTIGLTLVSLYSGRMVGVVAGFGGIAYLLFSEFVFIDDAYSGEYDRFNTTLKWWPWITAAVVLFVAPIVLEHTRRTWVRVLGVVFCLYPCVYAIDLGRHYWYTYKMSVGKLEGTRYLNDNEAARYMLARLKTEPRGVVVERPNKDSYTNSACLPLFAGHRLWLGWMGHEQLWHGFPSYMIQKQERLFAFYKGEQTDPTNWMRAEGVDYVLWYQDADTKELWEKIDPLMRSDFSWVEIWTSYEGKKVGFWRRNGAPLAR